MHLRNRLCSVAPVLCLATTLLFTCAARGEETPPLLLTIAFTGDVSGYLEPCG